ncbi:MAG: alpha/beta hydrolase [Pseudomonadota bacterium]
MAFGTDRRHVTVPAAAPAALLLTVTLTAPALAFQLAPYKDKLFRYPKVIEKSDDGTFERVGYDIERDLYGRDEVPESRVNRRYVSMKPRRREKKVKFNVAGRTMQALGVGRLDGGASAVVIYVHGKGGNRKQGANDWTFGGNFNRIRNLMLRNDGVYLSTDITDFTERGRDDVKALMKEQAARSPGAPIFVACGSMGGHICWQLARDREAAALLGGILLLGSVSNAAFLQSETYRSRRPPLPVYFGHGSADSVFDWKQQAAFARRIRDGRPGYPVRFTLFDTGSHGTPIRMTDWRLILNWMLAARS